MPILTSSLSHDYGWNERAARYIDLTTGRFVSGRTIARELDKVINASQSNIEGVTQSLIDGNTTIEQWQVAMEREIRTIHTASGAAARGGWAQMNQSDWGWVGSQVRKQYNWLDKFAADLASGKQPLNGRVMTRAKMYAKAGRGTFEEMQRRMMKVRGKAEERRVLGYAEHCAGCVEQAAQGWQPIGSLDPIGAEECFTNCACRFEYR